LPTPTLPITTCVLTWCQPLDRANYRSDATWITTSVRQWISGVLVSEPACVMMAGTLNISYNSNSNSNRYLSFELIPTVFMHMHHFTCGINSLLHSVNPILFTVLLVHLILRISPHLSHHLHSHHLSLPRPFTPNLKLISFTNPFLHRYSYSFRTAFTDLNLYWIKGTQAFVCFSFFSFWLRVLDKAAYSAFESTLNSFIVSYVRCVGNLHF